MTLGRMFERFRGTQKRSSHRLNSSRRSKRDRLAIQRLEDRLALAVFYRGVSQTSTEGTTDESFNYIVDVDSTGTGELWLRYEALQNRIDIADNPGFGNITNVRSPSPGFFGPAAVPQSVAAPFSLGGLITVGNAEWNKIGEKESFSSGALTIRASTGTRVFIANGDSLPLALRLLGDSNGGNASAVTVDGPIDSSVNKYASSPAAFNNWLTADTVTVRASMKTSSVTQIFSNNLVSIQNVITSPLTNAYVGNGDFQVIAGARIDGNVGVYMGQEGSTIGFGQGGGDVLIDGTINGSSVTLSTRSTTQPVTITTGPSGLLSGGGSLTLFNSGLDGGAIDVRSANFNVTNVGAGSPGGGVPDIGVTIEQIAGNLEVAAVPKSRGQISLTASGANSTIDVNANIDTEAGLLLDAPLLDIKSPIRTAAGDVILRGNTVTIGSNVTAGASGVGSVKITSRTAGVTVSSAAVVSAPDETITIDAKTVLSSLARLEARALDLKAGTSINVKANAKELRALAATGIVVDNVDSLLVRSAVTTGAAGATAIDISSQGRLDVSAASAQDTGGITLKASTGLRAKDVRTKNGSAMLSSSSGDVRLDGTVIVAGGSSDLGLSAERGNVIIDPTAILTVADQVAMSAPLGRVLTPGQVTGVTVTNGGSGYTSAPSVTLDAGSGGAAAPVVASGAIAGFEVLNGGSGYVTAPKVMLVGGGGTNATAQAFITNGVVTKVVVTNAGTGYTSAPQVVFFEGSGAGAEAKALLNGLSAINVTSPGSGYLVPPEVVVSSGAGATVAPITIDATGGITGINLSTAGSGYGLAPRVEIVDTSGSGFGATGTATLTGGVTGFTVTNQGSGYSSAPTVNLTGGNGTGATAEAIISGSVVTGTLTVTTGGTGYAPNPLVFFNGSGSGATGVATISGSVVSLAVSSGGSGYNAPPAVAISGGGGTGATATASLGLTNASFTVTNVPDLPNGSPPTIPTLYSIAPTVTITGGGGFGATAVATLNANGLVNGIQVQNSGTGYTSLPTVTISGGTVLRSGTNPTVTPNDVNFTVSGLTITNAGSGYSQNPAVTFSGGNGTGTVANALVRGAITSVQITAGGSGYTAAPTISFADSTGSGAIGPATTLNASVTALRILTPGSGYTSAPSVTFSGGGGTGAAATVALTSVVSGITVGQKGVNYNPATTTVRLVPVAGGEGAVAGAIRIDGSGKITGINVATGGQDYVTPPTVRIIDSSGSGSGATATATLSGGKVIGFAITAGGSGYNPGTTVVTLQAKGGGATAVANLDATGSIASVTVTNPGSGFDAANPPNVRLVPYGEGATATAMIGGGAVTGFTVTNSGRNYAVPPKVTLTGGGGTGATGIAVISNVATVNAGRLSWTALESPLDALSSQFSTLAINLTGKGNVVIDKKTGSLILEGASTTDGSVIVSAPVLSVKGAITIGDFDQKRDEKVELLASAGDLTIDAAVGNLLAGSLSRLPLARRVSLSAPAGSITASTTPAGLVTAEELVVSALSNVTLRTDVDFIRGSTTSAGAGMTITQNTLDSNGNPLKLTIGTANGGLTANDGTIRVTAADQIVVANAINAGSKGSVVLTAAGRIIEAVATGTADIVADSVTLESTNGKIDLDTSATRLSALAPLSTIDIDNVAATAIELVSATGRNGIRVSSAGTVTATNVATTNGPVAITTSGAASDINVGRIAAPTFPITLTAGRSILQPVTTSAAIIGSDAVLTAQAGALDVFVDVISVNAFAPESISIRDANALQIAGAVSSNNKQITLTVGGTLSQSAAIRTNGTLAINASGGEVTLTNHANDVGSLTVSNPTRGVAFRDANALAIGAAGIVGGAVDLTVGGSLTQTGAVTASSLSITSTAGGPIAFNNTANDVDSISITNTGNDIAFTDRDDVAIGSFRGRDITITAGGALTQAVGGAVTATGTFTINFTGPKQPVTLNGANELARFSIDNGTQPVTLNDVSDLELVSITAGAVTLSVGGTLTQSGGILATSLAASSTGGAINLGGSNDVGTLSVTNPGRAVTFRDVNALGIATLSGSAVQLTVGGGLTQSGALTATSLKVDASAGDIALTNATNAVGVIAGSNPGRGFSLTTNGGLIQSAGIVAGTFSIVNNGAGQVLLTDANDVDSVAVNNGNRTVRFRDLDGVNIAGIVGGEVKLEVGAGVTQSGQITASNLVVDATSGVIVLDTATNAVALFTAQTSAGDVVFVNANTFSTGLITAGTTPVGDGNIFLKAVTGNILVTGNLSAVKDTITLDARAGTFTLNNGVSLGAGSLVYYVATGPNLGTGTTLPAVVAPNGVWTITGGAIAISGLPISTFDGDISIIGTTLNVDGALQALGANRRITISTTNGVTGAGSLVATELVVTNGANAVSLTGNNNFDTVSIANPGRTVSYRDANGFSIGSAGIQGSNVSLNAAGALAQIGAVTASSLAVALSSGNVSLGNAGNDVGSLSISNPGRSVAFNDSNALAIAGIQAGSFSLTTGGDITQAGSLTVSTLSATTPASLTLSNPGNSIPAISQVTAGGTVTIATTGNLSIGPAVTPTALLKSNTQVNLAGVVGNVILENGGRIDSPSIILGTGDSIVISVGGSDSATALGNAIVSANQMPGVPTTISLVAGSTVSLTEALPPVDSPIVMVGNGATIRNAGAVAVGLLLLDGSSGSQISGVTFQGFTSAGMALDGSQNTTISGVTFVGNSAGLAAQGNLAGTRVIGSTFQNNAVGAALQNATNLVFGGIGAASNLIANASRTSTGLLISGTSTGTRVIGNRFNGHAQAIQLTSATGVTVGGSARGEGNTISGAARAGVFASGFCTRSQVIKTVFARTPRTPTPFNVRSARGLRIVK